MIRKFNWLVVALNKFHMWHFRIELEYYSVVYFERITEFDVL